MGNTEEFKVQIRERSDPSEDYKRPELLQKAIEEIEAEVAAKEAESGSSSDDDSSAYDSDEEEDEDANLLTPAVDSQIFKTIAAIRSKDPRVYEQTSKFYDDTAAESSNSKKPKEKVVKLKDYERDILVNHGGLVDERKEAVTGKTHAQEQEDLRNAFKLAAESDEEEEEDGFLTKKDKSEQEKEAEESEYRQFLLEHMKDDEPSKKAFEEWNNYKSNPKINAEDAFLIDYVLNRGWVDKGNENKKLDDDVDKEEEYLDDVDRFESKYNFRFEEEGAAEIKTYSRNVEGSVRRKESKRARRREREKLHKQAKKEQKLQEVKEQKNKKMKEIQEKLKELRDITGMNASGLENIDLDADFDPDNFDAQMNDVFNDEYYNDAGTNEKPTWDDDDIMDADYLPGGDKYVGDDAEQPAAQEDPEVAKSKKRKLDDLMEEYYSLNYEDVVGGDTFTRFKYVKTDPVDFGLTAEEILLADDKALSNYVGMKTLAPYRNEKKLARELKSFEKSKDKKKKDVLKTVKKAKEILEKEVKKEEKALKKQKKSKKSKSKKSA